MSPTAPHRGVYAPVTVFFNEDGSIDDGSLQKHITRLARGGLKGLVISGSNGEAVHLSRQERIDVIRLARSTLDTLGLTTTTIIAGCGVHSTSETIQLCKDAATAGAAFALVLPPNYWAGAMNKAVLAEFFSDVADESPIPILLYNFPAVANGIDLDSDFILEAASHPNIVGAKLTCCNVGKLQRISSNVSKSGSSFNVLVGKSEAFLPGLVAGSGGLIGALVNLIPRTHVELLRLYDNGQLHEAQKLQAAISDADYAVVKLGVPGLKSVLEKYFGYGGGRSRKPLGKVDAKSWPADTVTKVERIMQLEASLEGVKATTSLLGATMGNGGTHINGAD